MAILHTIGAKVKCSSACSHVTPAQVVDILIYKGREELEVGCP